MATPSDIITSLDATYKALFEKLKAIEQKFSKYIEESDEYLVIVLPKDAKIHKRTLRDLFKLSENEVELFIKQEMLHPDGWHQFTVREIINLKKHLKNTGRL